METEILVTVIGAVFTVISPVVIQWRKRPGWSTLLKVGLPVLVSLAIAVVYLLATEALAGQNLLAAFLIVYGLQQLVYSTLLKNLASFGSSDGRHEASDTAGYSVAEPHEPTEAAPDRYERGL